MSKFPAPVQPQVAPILAAVLDDDTTQDLDEESVSILNAALRTVVQELARDERASVAYLSENPQVAEQVAVAMMLFPNSGDELGRRSPSVASQALSMFPGERSVEIGVRLLDNMRLDLVDPTNTALSNAVRLFSQDDGLSRRTFRQNVPLARYFWLHLAGEPELRESFAKAAPMAAFTVEDAAMGLGGGLV